MARASGCLRIEFETGDERKNLFLREAGSQKLFGQLGLAVGERSGFVENGSAAGVNLFKGDGILNNNGTPRGQGDGTNDGDWDGDEQWTRGGDHQDGQKTDGFTAESPRQERNGHGDRGVNGPELISQPAQSGPVLLGLAHDFHDFGVA